MLLMFCAKLFGTPLTFHIPPRFDLRTRVSRLPVWSSTEDPKIGCQSSSRINNYDDDDETTPLYLVARSVSLGEEDWTHPPLPSSRCKRLDREKE